MLSDLSILSLPPHFSSAIWSNIHESLFTAITLSSNPFCTSCTHLVCFCIGTSYAIYQYCQVHRTPYNHRWTEPVDYLDHSVRKAANWKVLLSRAGAVVGMAKVQMLSERPFSNDGFIIFLHLSCILPVIIYLTSLSNQTALLKKDQPKWLVNWSPTLARLGFWLDLEGF